ncbi:MAG: SAM-dependent methyltransferase [Acidimicrobiia bacterium]
MTAYVDADFHDPDLIITDARNVLNLTQPVAVMFTGVLGHVADFDEMRSIVARVMAAVPSGSYLVLCDGINADEAAVEAGAKYAETGAVPYNLRSLEEIGQCFEGLEMVEPGLVPITRWRPATVEVGEAKPIDSYGAVARKP